MRAASLPPRFLSILIYCFFLALIFSRFFGLPRFKVCIVSGFVLLIFSDLVKIAGKAAAIKRVFRGGFSGLPIALFLVVSGFPDG